MRYFTILFILLFNIGNLFSQKVETYRVKKNPGKVILTPHYNSQIIMLRVSGLFYNARKVIYYDTINGYQARVPKSFEMQETNNLYNFCMTIPRDNGRDNAICINSAPKEDYGSFENFKNHIITNPDYIGQNQKNWILGNESYLISVDSDKINNYDSYKVKFSAKGRALLGQFIILETKKSYLWINYMADLDTYDSDINKFSKFLKKLEFLE